MKLTTENAHLFWDGMCSQWVPIPITIDGILYNCNEQYMMAMKAKLFGDEKIHTAIMYSNEPRNQKALGREVVGFDPVKWNEVCRLVVYRANLAKFTQDKIAYDWLLDTGDKLIVEASPVDKIWGIGLHQSKAEAWDTEKWQGKNWLGEAIMQVRSDIKQLGLSPVDKITKDKVISFPNGEFKIESEGSVKISGRIK